MLRRVPYTIVLMLISVLTAALLSGCDVAETAFKSTSKLQTKRDKRNSRAIDLVDQAPKLGEKK
jgi:hypothetical protein